MPVIILGGIYGGIMTTTEAAGVAVIYAIPVGFVYIKDSTRGHTVMPLSAAQLPWGL